MGTRFSSVEKRIEKLAIRMGCCPKHMCKLRCMHEYEWVGSLDDVKALAPLLDKLDRYVATVPPAPGLCPVCGQVDGRWCEQCCAEADSRVTFPEDAMSAAEWSTYRRLSGLLRLKEHPHDITHPGVDIVLHWGDAEPPQVSAEAPEPPKASADEPENLLHDATGSPPTSATDDADDAELEDLVRQLQARLSR